MNNDLVWWKGKVRQLLKLKPLMCVCKTDIAIKRQQIVEYHSAPQGSCDKCQRKIKKS